MGETRYTFGPFHLDIDRHVLLRDGKPQELKGQPVRVLRVLVEHPNELISYERFGKEIWGEDTYVDVPHSLSQSISKIKKVLGDSHRRYITNDRKIGYKFDRTAMDSDARLKGMSENHKSRKSEMCEDLGTDPEIEKSLSGRGFTLASIDGYVGLENDGRGWCREEVKIKPAGSYKPTEDFANLIRKFEAEPPVRQYFSFQDYDSSVKDQARLLVLYFQAGDWGHIYALNEAMKRVQTDTLCSGFRQRCEHDLLPSPDSRLYRNVNCEVLVVSSDNQIVLGRRRLVSRSGHAVPFFPGAWSATLEEQMLRFDPKEETNPDSHLFDCAHRGVDEELRVPIKKEETRLLGYGIEWGNFTAAFLLVVYVSADFAEIAKRWRHASDRNEAIALDALPGTEQSVSSALLNKEWIPSSRARTWKSADAKARDVWHPTARARLCAYLEHLEFLSGEKK